MLRALLCWFFGHVFTEKVVTGKCIKYFLGDSYTAHTSTWKQLPFCVRCGKNNISYEK